MKHLLPFLLGVTLLAAACNKNGADPMSVYTVNGVQDVTIERGGVASLAMVVEHKEGPQGTVSLSLKGLPDGVTASFTPGASGTPTFSTGVTFSATTLADTGTFPLTVEAASAEMGSKAYQMKLQVKLAPDCSADRFGTYATTEVCVPGQFTYSSTVLAGNAANRILFKDFADYAGLDIYADLECLLRTITIPSQTMNGITVSGSGSFSQGQMIIHYTATQGSTTYNCTMTMNKL